MLLRPRGNCELLIDPFSWKHSANALGEKVHAGRLRGVSSAPSRWSRECTFDRRAASLSHSLFSAKTQSNVRCPVSGNLVSCCKSRRMLNPLQSQLRLD